MIDLRLKLPSNWHSKKKRKLVDISSNMALSAEAEKLLAPLRASVKVTYCPRSIVFFVKKNHLVDIIFGIYPPPPPPKIVRSISYVNISNDKRYFSIL